MGTREDYIDKLAAQLKEWSVRIDELEVKAHLARADMKDVYEEQIRLLKEKRNASQNKLDDLKVASAEAWDTLKTGAETAWAEMQKAVSEAKAKFN